MTKKIFTFAIATWVVEFLLILLVHLFLGDESYLFHKDHDLVNIVIGVDATICYLSPEDHTVKICETHVNDNQEMFEQWRRLSGLPEDVTLNHMESQSGYEEELDYGNSKILQYVAIDPIVECDLSDEIYLYAPSDFDALIDTWAQTIRGRWGRELGSLTISVEGKVVYEK